jgi:hypothetical protein
LEESRAEQAAKALVKFGKDHLSLLRRVNGPNQHDAKKATTEFNQLFPQWTLNAAEKTQLKTQQRDMTREEKRECLQEEKEANEIIALRYKPDNGEYWSHFKGRTMGDGECPGKDIPFLNLLWVQHHFHDKFVAMVKEYGKASEGWVPVLVGSAWFIMDAPSPTSSVVPSVICHYPQGDKNYCMFYSFASTHFLLVWKRSPNSSEWLAMLWSTRINNCKSTG